MRIIVWKWKANAVNYIGKEGVVGVWIPAVWMGDDQSLLGRDGYVGYVESVSK
jgi:hypothetical protein